MVKKLRSVLITAGASGIGRAVADCFAESGYDVHVCDINSNLIDAISKEDNQITGSVCDVAEPDQVKQLIDQLLGKSSGVDVLVNNAGIPGGNAQIEDIELSTWKKTLDVNLSGMFYFIKNLTPVMKNNGSGSIINISTASVRTGMLNRLPYIATKEAVSYTHLTLPTKA